MHSPIVLPSGTITFRQDLQVMVVRWHTHADFKVVQADYAEMLAAAEVSGFTNWLLDVRLRLAVLSSPALTAAYRTDPGHQKEVAFALNPARPFDIALFEDEGKAMQWLRPL